MKDSSRSRSGTAFASAAREPFHVVRAQRAAFLAEPMAVALLDAMPGPALVLNPRRQIVAFNGRLVETLGLSQPEELLGLRPGEAVSCTHASERTAGCGTTASCAQCGAVNAVLECLATRGRVVRECRILVDRPVRGGALDLRVHATLVTFGPHDYVVLGLEDIRDEKRRELLERAFFHDLLGACRDVHDLAGTLRREELGPAERADCARELERLSGSVVDQVDAQRLLLAAERGELPVNPEEVDLSEALAEMVERLRREPLARGRSICFESSRHCRVETDPVLLARVLGCLVRGALEATCPGGTVEVTCEYDHEVATLTVHNEGAIPEQEQQQLFQRSFSTLDAPDRGIGAYAVRLLVEHYLNGRIAFTSEPRVGTLFVVMLPRRIEGARAA